MIGYHYTSRKNWESIQKEGLIPYPIEKENFPPDLKGIWLWKEKHSPLAHVGGILYQVGMKAETEIVYLEVEYYFNNKLEMYGNYEIGLFHYGNIENLIYHTGEEAVIITLPIISQNIRLLDSYDLENLKEYKKISMC